MVDEGKLSAVLSELAFTLATDFPLTAILDHLVERIVDVLPVTSAGVTLIDPGVSPRYVAASDESALLFERLQTDLAQGPCVLAFESGSAVAVPDLSVDDRFPEFGPAAVEAGLAAVFTFPLRHAGGRFGALDLYRGTTGDLSVHAMEVAQTLANVAAAYLLNARAREETTRSHARFQHLAMHDALTGLPNRLLLQERIEQASRRAQRSGAQAAILFIDLDRFKQVNDTHGHQVGDELLRGVGRRLSGLLRPSDTLARLYGDEFVLLCEDLDDLRDVEVLADRIRSAFSTPFATSGTALTLTASIGVAFAGPGEYVTEVLIAEADSAMYDAKRRGLVHEVVDLRDAVQHNESGRLSRDLRTALTENGLDLVYQPLVRCRDGLVCGVEALLRWNHPDRGPISPPSIVAVAEQSGLMNRLGTWVLTQACTDAVRWRVDHPDSPFDLAVNVSAQQLMQPDFVAEVTSVLAATGIVPRSLVLEVTETILIEDGERALLVLHHLKALGVRIALDDFGTGYSSLSYLHRLPIDVLNIDQSFVADVEHGSRGAAIVAAVTNLAHALDLVVVAEGVETRRQRDVLTSIGADQAQGYYFARPLPAAGIDELLEAAAPGALHRPALSAPGPGHSA
jgi:diguanylate cyclase (GGDEF)-like protein